MVILSLLSTLFLLPEPWHDPSTQPQWSPGFSMGQFSTPPPPVTSSQQAGIAFWPYPLRDLPLGGFLHRQVSLRGLHFLPSSGGHPCFPFYHSFFGCSALVPCPLSLFFPLEICPFRYALPQFESAHLMA